MKKETVKDRMPVVDVAFFLLAAVFYALSVLAYVACWIGGSRRCERIAQPALIVAVALHGLAILLRWIQAGHAPLSNGFEAFSFYAWGLCLAYLLIPSLRRHSVLGAFITPLALISIIVASVLPKEIKPLVPVLQSNWLPVHVGISFGAYAMFTLAFVAAVAYLLKLRSLKQPGRWLWARQLPSLETLETLQRRTAVVGLVLMTGALVSGSLWAEKAWGIVWPWEPQQVASLVTWFIYALYFFARHNLGWQDQRGSWLLVGGFVMVLVTFVGADLLMLDSRHSFLFGT
ncbi:c-type cytochrome biogenesis protein CcsB [Chloroflexota bacterium]